VWSLELRQVGRMLYFFSLNVCYIANSHHCAVNEPWQHTPLAILKEFYWEGYQKVQNLAPHWIFLFHDSFDPSVKAWGDFLFGCPNYAIDSHIYQAWAPQDSIATFVDQTCNDALRLRELRDAGLPFIIGEWSLATV
jgi:glucan 1,3-beta-glucosidase